MHSTANTPQHCLQAPPHARCSQTDTRMHTCSRPSPAGCTPPPSIICAHTTCMHACMHACTYACTCARKHAPSPPFPLSKNKSHNAPMLPVCVYMSHAVLQSPVDVFQTLRNTLPDLVPAVMRPWRPRRAASAHCRARPAAPCGTSCSKPRPPPHSSPWGRAQQPRRRRRRQPRLRPPAFATAFVLRLGLPPPCRTCCHCCLLPTTAALRPEQSLPRKASAWAERSPACGFGNGSGACGGNVGIALCVRPCACAWTRVQGEGEEEGCVPKTESASAGGNINGRQRMHDMHVGAASELPRTAAACCAQAHARSAMTLGRLLLTRRPLPSPGWCAHVCNCMCELNPAMGYCPPPPPPHLAPVNGQARARDLHKHVDAGGKERQPGRRHLRRARGWGRAVGGWWVGYSGLG